MKVPSVSLIQLAVRSGLEQLEPTHPSYYWHLQSGISRVPFVNLTQMAKKSGLFSAGRLIGTDTTVVGKLNVQTIVSMVARSERLLMEWVQRSNTKAASKAILLFRGKCHFHSNPHEVRFQGNDKPCRKA